MRLIDGDALLHALATQTMNNGKTDDMRKGVFAALEYCRQIIEMQPTIEAKTVRHGRWIVELHKDAVTGAHTVSECSECGYLCFTAIKNYCANCGAKMDGGADK